MEEWKDIEWYEWKYQVSGNGYVKNQKWNIIKWWIDKNWYINISLSNNWAKKYYKIHRIVATSFLDNPINKETVNHKNGVKTDNRVENLEWSTRSENSKHAYDFGLMKNNNFQKCHPYKWKFWVEHNKSKTVIQYTLKWDFIQEWWSCAEIRRVLGLLHISECCTWINKTCWWYIWKYKLW
jgi:hypothetical protein